MVDDEVTIDTFDIPRHATDKNAAWQHFYALLHVTGTARPLSKGGKLWR
jgi:hypothetical protein